MARRFESTEGGSAPGSSSEELDFSLPETILKLPTERQAVALAIVAKKLSVITVALNENHELLEQLGAKLLKRKLPLNESQMLAVLQAAMVKNSNKIFTGNTVCAQIEEYLATNSVSEPIARAVGFYKNKILHGRWYQNGVDSAGQKLLHRIDLAIKKSVTGEVPIPIAAEEAWSDQAIADITLFDTQIRQHWLQLIDHCGKTSGTTPSASWTKRANEFVTTIGEDSFADYLHKWFSLVPKKGSRTGQDTNGFGTEAADQYHPQNVEILKGLAYCCAGRTDDRLASALGDAAESSFKKVVGLGPRCAKLGTACVHSLASMNTKESVAQLTRVQARAKHASVRTQIDKALNNAATKSGMTVDDLQDIGVPDFGMHEVGKLVRKISECTAELTIGESSTIVVSWKSSSGKSQRSVPSELKSSDPEALKELKKIEKDLVKLLPGLRHRIEHSFINQRHWRFEEWRKRLLDHPVTGTIARRLLWSFNGRAGVWFDGKFIDQSGITFTPEDAALVELWHPIGAEPREVLHWRRWLTEHKIVQPFKQCHREIYVLTDAEMETRTHSNRFAAHILKQHQLQHLCMQRGWKYQLMGSFDSQNTPTLELPRWNLTVEFYVDAPGDTNAAGIATTVSSDQVKFIRCHPNEPAYHQRYAPLQLSEVMPIVFSEAMRDVDLFVSVCSIGTDPNWAEGYREYWEKFSFGELTNSAETRKQVLQDVIPRLRIASRCSFDNRYLVVRGDIRTYKIHMGSGNILMEPNDQYLCIVQGRGLLHSTDPVFLPFEGDRLLSVILSKAVMLAEDTKIKDQSILSQIKHKL